MFIDYLGPKAEQRGEPAPRYADEILCANWNPAVLLATACFQNEHVSSRPRTSEDATTIDVKAFLDRFYALSI